MAGFERQLDHAALLDAYKAFKGSDPTATDRAFMADLRERGTVISEPHLRRLLKRWRDNANAGADPLTGKPDAAAAGAFVRALTEAEEQADGQGAGYAERQDLEPASIAARSILAKLPAAQRVYAKALKNQAVKPFAFKAAQDVLKAAGELAQQKKATATASEFAAWPDAALADLLASLAPDFFKARAGGSAPTETATAPSEAAAPDTPTAPDGLPASV